MASLAKLSSGDKEEGEKETWLLGRYLNIVGNFFRMHLYFWYARISRETVSPAYVFILSPDVKDGKHSGYTVPMTFTSPLRNKT